MKIEQISDYIHAEFLAVADPSTSIDDIFSDKNPDLLFERFEDRLIWYLLKSTSLELSVDGRSNQVIDELLWDEYHNGTPADQERITKQVKTALHNLYKARFIRRDRDNTVFLGSNIHIYRVYGQIGEDGAVIPQTVHTFFGDRLWGDFKNGGVATCGGKIIKGDIQAENEQIAGKLLLEQDLIPQSIAEDGIGIFGNEKRITNKDRITFTRQLSTLIGAGLPLATSLALGSY